VPAATVDEYIEAAPESARDQLREMRRIILSAAPEVQERIAYGMPSYELNGRRIVHFAAAKTHLGVYGLVHVDAEIPGELAAYVDHRSTLRFKLNEPLPAAALAKAVESKSRALSDG
jgi:uncharacterized protein YdhG (YjbR/CyaY superfamily)